VLYEIACLMKVFARSVWPVERTRNLHTPRAGH